MTTNEKQNKRPEAGKKELTPRQIQMRKKMVVFPLFFLAFAGCMWLIFSPGEKEREEPSAGFNTVGSDLREPERNSIRAAVQQTVTLTDGGEVTFRLLEPMMAGDLLIPSGTPVTGAARINGERLTVKVSAVQHGGAVVPVDLSVYDTNGNEGIPVPGSEELNAVKEIAANMGAGMGSSITITDDAGSQLLSDLGRSAIQGVSQYVSKKMRSVKVTLKAGYSVLLLPPLQ